MQIDLADGTYLTWDTVTYEQNRTGYIRRGAALMPFEQAVDLFGRGIVVAIQQHLPDSVMATYNQQLSPDDAAGVISTVGVTGSGPDQGWALRLFGLG